MNNAQLIGRLIKKPMLSYTQSGKAVLHFTIAVDNPFSKDAPADLINIEQWNKAAENSANYLIKGEQVAVTGAIRSYKDKNGNFATKVVANSVEFLSSKAEVAALQQKNDADEQAAANQQQADFQQGAPVQQ